MWKVFLYHQWQYEKAEKFLMDMESEGYRLKRIKDHSYAYYEACKYVLGSCGGAQVCGKRFFEPEVYRITHPESDLAPVKKFRNNYLKRAFRSKMLMSLIFMMPAIPLFFIDNAHYDWRAYVLSFIAMSAVATFVYYAFGLLSLGKKTAFHI